tara:strand:- start:235 stop:1257 length:1023 start_codon:yes stop_codon:yes gene_type:complete
MVKKVLFIVAFLSQSIFAVNDEAIMSKKPEAKLSDYGFFKSHKDQIPNNNVHKYFLQTPLFSDYSLKDRFVYIPQGKKAIHSLDRVYEFPIGSALVKTFSYEMASNENKVLLETRLLLLQETGWSAHTYVWDESQEDAYLKVSGKTIEGIEFLYEGKPKKVNYRVPNQNQCKECHLSDDKIIPIGPKSRNLNFEVIQNNKIINQIDYWIENGLVEIHQPQQVVADWQNIKESLDDRARAYLDVNCGHCHMPGGSADTTGLYLTVNEKDIRKLGVNKPPVAAGRASGNLMYSIVPGKPDKSILLYRMKSQDPGIMMPESGRALAHSEGIRLIESWIKNYNK